MSAYVAWRKVKLTNGLLRWTAVSQSSNAWNFVVVSLLLSRMMKILGGLSWIEQPQNPNRLNLFIPSRSLADLVVDVRVPAMLIPFGVPLLCCILVTIARTVLEMSCSQLGSMSGGRVVF